MHSPRSSARREQSSSATPPQQREPLPAPIPSSSSLKLVQPGLRFDILLKSTQIGAAWVEVDTSSSSLMVQPGLRFLSSSSLLMVQPGLRLISSSSSLKLVQPVVLMGTPSTSYIIILCYPFHFFILALLTSYLSSNFCSLYYLLTYSFIRANEV